MLSRRNNFRRNRTMLSQNPFLSLMEDFLSPSLREVSSERPSLFDVIQKTDELTDAAITSMFVPGITTDHVDVSVNTSGSAINVVITVNSENADAFVQGLYPERFQQVFQLTPDYDVEQTTVELTNGILKLSTPRLEKSTQSVKLPINTTNTTKIEGKKK